MRGTGGLQEVLSWCFNGVLVLRDPGGSYCHGEWFDELPSLINTIIL